MRRRKFVASVGTGVGIGLAGCSGGSSSVNGNVKNKVANAFTVKITDEGIQDTGVGEAYTVNLMIKNDEIETITYWIEATVKNSQGETLMSGQSTREQADPGENTHSISFTEADPESVSEYTLVVKSEEYKDTPTETGESGDDSTSTPESISISFEDDWEDGNYQQNPAWNVEMSKPDSEVNVVEKSSPRGGSKALDVHWDFGDTVRLITDRKFRWDAPWEIKSLFTFETPADNTSMTLEGQYDPETHESGVSCYLDVSEYGDVDISLGGNFVNPSEAEGSPEYVEGAWYWLKITQESGKYQATLWNAEKDEPDPQVSTDGNAPATAEKPLEIEFKGAVQMDYISYVTQNSK